MEDHVNVIILKLCPKKEFQILDLNEETYQTLAFLIAINGGHPCDAVPFILS
jgi:hypothetical protein